MSQHWNGYSFEEGEGDGRHGGWVQTYTGRKFYPLDARVEDVDLLDISHHLSQQCRFSGACRYHYSVAQHSVLVARLVSEATQDAATILWGLLHDAPEAYLVDLPRPIKHSPGFGSYALIERRLMGVVCDWAAIPHAMPALVEAADRVLLATERRDLLGPDCHWEVPGVEPLPNPIMQWPMDYAKAAYIELYRKQVRRLHWAMA
jgi:hypothetical protein